MELAIIVEDLLEMVVVYVKNHTMVLDANIANMEFQFLKVKMELLILKDKDHFAVILAYRALTPYLFTYFIDFRQNNNHHCWRKGR